MALALAFTGVLIGTGVSAAMDSRKPWNLVITAVTVAIALLSGWTVVNLRYRQR
jgi:uncharacterized membrane protein (UPF0136 family)